MRQRSIQFLSLVAMSLSLILGMIGCGSDGTSHHDAVPEAPNEPADDSTLLPATTVIVEGLVDDGKANSPVANAICRFVTLDGTQVSLTAADTNGEFSLHVPPESQGYVQCSPPNLLSLRLSTFISTVGLSAGEVIPPEGAGREEVTPRTTVVAEVIDTENPADPQARKEELVAAIEQDPTLRALVDAATALFEPLMKTEINVTFVEEANRRGSRGLADNDSGDASEDDGGEDGGDGADADSDGGAEGDADDGGEFSPIPHAICDFALTLDSEVLVNTVLSDIFDNGRLERPDLQVIADQVNAELAGREQEIAEAFKVFFPAGIGSPLRVEANAEGRYFLPTPVGVPGFVRCRPPNQQNLVLATFVRARQFNEILTGQDVTPQTTVFSTSIATKLVGDLASTKQNYLDDIAGLRVVPLDRNNPLAGFNVEAPDEVNDNDVGMVAFAATALFDVLFKSGHDIAFLDALNELVTRTEISADFLTALGLPTDAAAAVASAVNGSTAIAEEQLETSLDAALSTARIKVRVTESLSGTPVAGATVDVGALPGNVQCQNCPQLTGGSGETLLTFTRVSLDRSTAIALTAAQAGFEAGDRTTEVVAFATVNADIPLLGTPNQPPVAGDDAYLVLEGGRLAVPADNGVLRNDSDPNDDPPDAIATALVVGPANGTLVLSPDGAFSYTPDANFSGEDLFAYQARDDGGTDNGGNDTSNVAIVILTVTEINDAPVFTPGPDQLVPENVGVQVVPNWAADITPGPLNEAAQALTFVVSNDNHALFAVQPDIDARGNLSYTPATDVTGQATVTVRLQDNGGTEFGGQDTSPPSTFTITVSEVNDAPSFTAGPNQGVLEDAGAQSVAGWATTISPGPPDEASQTVTFLVSNDNNALFAVPPAILNNGTLTYTPAPNANGQAVVTVALQDDGGTLFGGVDTSPQVTFTITVSAVNDAPRFNLCAKQIVPVDAGAQTVNGCATAISPGPPDEASQTVTFLVSNDNNALFATQPAIDVTGALTYTPVANTTGQATVTVRLQDDGGTAFGGQNTSPSATLTIEVVAINNPPSFTLGPSQVVSEDAGPQTVVGWATDISPGPPDEASQTVAFLVSNNNTALFAVQPAVDASGTLTYTPAANTTGQATVTVRLQDDGGTAFGGQNTSLPGNFTIAVAAVNDAPSFNAGANQGTEENAGPQTVVGWATTISPGPPDEVSQTVTFLVSNDNNALFATQPAIDASGTLTYTPAANTTGQATVTVQLQDDGGTANGGQDTSPAQVFTINVQQVQAFVALDRDRQAVVRIDLLSGACTTISDATTGSGPAFVRPVDMLIEATSTPVVVEDGFGLAGLLRVVPATGDRTVVSDETTGTGPFLVHPQSVTIEAASGALIVAEDGFGVYAVVRVDPDSGDRTTISDAATGSGPALVFPKSIVEANGQLYVVDASLRAVFRIDPATGNRTIISDDTTGTGDPFAFPTDLAVDINDNLLVVDATLRAVIQVDPGTGNRTIISDDVTGIGDPFVLPMDIVIEPDGNLLLVDNFLARVVRVDPTTGNRTTIVSPQCGL